MSFPSTAFQWSRVLDPADVLDYTYDVSGLLDTANSEGVSSYTLTLLSDATAVGLTVGTGAYAPVQVNSTTWRIWFSISAGFQSHPSFNGTGALLPMELTIVTNSTPARTIQRTMVLQVAQQ